MLTETRRDYRHLETSLALGKQPEWLAQSQALLLKIPADSLFFPWVATTACVSLDPLTVPIADGLAVCQVAMNFAPTVESGVNAAVIRWRGGQESEATQLLRRLRLATSYQPGGVDARLTVLQAPTFE